MEGYIEGSTYIVKQYRLSPMYYKIKVLEETKSTYFIEYLDTDRKVRYGKDEFNSEYIFVELIGTEPEEN